MLGDADTGADFGLVEEFVNDVEAAVIPTFEIGTPRPTDSAVDQVNP